MTSCRSFAAGSEISSHCRGDPDTPEAIMGPCDRNVLEIRERRQRAQPNRVWAKFEILLGLLGVAVGILLGAWSVRGAELDLILAMTSLALMILGGYLTLAGQSSHLYHSTFEQTGFLIDEIQDLKSHQN